MQLTPHFTLKEMTFSQTAIRQGINNTPDKSQIRALTALCVHILEPLRILVDKSIRVTSGYRSHDLNRAIGGSATSQHLVGAAADINVEGLSPQELFDLIRHSDLPFDQLIQEFDEWVHVSFTTRRRRGSVLFAIRDKRGRVKYVKNKPR
jgi:hypothetical protein